MVRIRNSRINYGTDTFQQPLKPWNYHLKISTVSSLCLILSSLTAYMRSCLIIFTAQLSHSRIYISNWTYLCEYSLYILCMLRLGDHDKMRNKRNEAETQCEIFLLFIVSNAIGWKVMKWKYCGWLETKIYSVRTSKRIEFHLWYLTGTFSELIFFGKMNLTICLL